MENRFSNCCFDFEVVGFHSECGRLICKGNHSPAFTIYREKPHGFHCYCLNQQQLDQYWRCIVEDCKFMCPSECGHCGICREMSCIFVELQEAYFFQPNLICRSASDDKPFQPVMWRVFNRNINKNNTFLRLKLQNQFHILALLQIMGRHCDRKFIVFLIHGYFRDRKNHHFSCCCLKCKRLNNI